LMLRMGLRKEGHTPQAGRLVKPQKDIHVLHGLAGRPFHQIIEGGDNHQPAGAQVHFAADITEIAAPDKVGGGKGTRQTGPHKALVLIEIPVEIIHLVLGDLFGQAGIDRAQDTADHGHKMGSEGDGNLLAGKSADLLLDFRGMTMAAHLIGLEAGGDLAIEGGNACGPTGPGSA
jgi:hypothetical protein